MDRIQNNINIEQHNILSTNSNYSNKTYFPKVKQKPDSIELSNKQENKNKLKLIIVGGLLSAAVIWGTIKTHKIFKNKKLKKLAEEEAKKLKAETEAKAKAEAKVKAEAEANNKIPSKIKIQRPSNLPPSINKGLDFGEDLAELIQKKQATTEQIQEIVNKHFPEQNINIHSMSEYHNFGPTGIKAGNTPKAAVTRPTFNEDGKLEKIDLFLPDVDYNNKESTLEYLDKTVHEFTHVAQFTNSNNVTKEYMKPTLEGRLINYIQKTITDMYTDKMVVDTAKSLIKESGTSVKTLSDYNKFMDAPSNIITREKIGSILNIGIDEISQKQNINQIFDIMFDSMAQKMKNDPNFINAIQKRGSYAAFKSEIKNICAESLRNEEEAYKAGQLMRQGINGTTGQKTNNDIIHIIMGMCADALK